jgi:hypothetical protein
MSNWKAGAFQRLKRSEAEIGTRKSAAYAKGYGVPGKSAN